MKERTKSLLQVLMMVAIGISLILLGIYLKPKKTIVESEILEQELPDTVPKFFSLTAKEGLKEALVYYDIQYPDIVYTQAILETGHFTSNGCLRHNNLFGLYNSEAGRYHRFDHWIESVTAYKEWIQRRYKPPEDYYKFLQRIGYASDSNYVNKLRNIVKNESGRSKGVSLERDSTVTGQ